MEEEGAYADKALLLPLEQRHSSETSAEVESWWERRPTGPNVQR